VLSIVVTYTFKNQRRDKMNVKQASTELYTLEEGDIFRIAPVSEEDGLREDVWYRFLHGPDDVGCYSFESVNDAWDYHECEGCQLVMLKTTINNTRRDKRCTG
jgi:hypothetical protein